MLEQIKAEVAAGNVNAQRHPTLPLTIFKYTKPCVYAGNWNDITLKCRGIVLDDDGTIVINPMPKFFNHFEVRGAETLAKNRGVHYVVTDKLDGSLINAARYKDELIVCSSGSFISSQATNARKIIEDTGLDAKILDGLTYSFEYIAPTNRIVLNYGDKVSLDLLSIRETATGEDAQYSLINDGLLDIFQDITIEEILAELPRADFINKEGFIVTFANGDRVKYKYDEYMRLHKIVSGVNEKFVWECLRDNIDINTVLDNVPDELYDFIDATREFLLTQFSELYEGAQKALDAVKVFETRKEKALHLKEFFPKEMKYVFALLDNRDVAPLIWKDIEPENTRTGMGEKTVDKAII